MQRSKLSAARHPACILGEFSYAAALAEIAGNL
jgi:hypothetical protein